MASIKDIIFEDDSDIEEEFRSLVQEEYELQVDQLPDNIKTSFRVDYIMNEDDLTMTVKFVSENEKINKLGNWETVFKFELVRHPSTYKLEIKQYLERFKLPKTLFEGKVSGFETLKSKIPSVVDTSLKIYLKTVYRIELVSGRIDLQIAKKVVSILNQRRVAAEIIPNADSMNSSQSTTEVVVGRERRIYIFQFNFSAESIPKFEIYEEEYPLDALYSVDVSKVSVEDIMEKVFRIELVKP
ncbi:MAG TPA: hypothetical protein PLP33_19790 [Leptospiraceae bacterium]|nr:hypothetical protein [Leptospiraceae bacterium]